MFRKHEKSISWKAGLLAILVHFGLLGMLFISFNWKIKHDAVSVSDVKLWDSIPSAQSPVTSQPKPVVEQKPKPEPIVQEKPKPKPEAAKIDIALQIKQKEALRKKEEAKKKALAKKRKLAAIKKAKLVREKKIKDAIAKQDQLDKVRQAIAAEEAAEIAKQASVSRASIVDEYIAKIQAKIRGNVNKTLCGDGNPELGFKIELLPNGEYKSSPSLTKSSKIPACDEAVERAIIVSEPLPLPKDLDALAKFRDLNLKFRPNG